jgi:hypothetical protein
LPIFNAQLSDAGNYDVALTNAPSHLPGVLTRKAVLTVLADTDKDGLADVWETEHGFNLNEPSDAAEDADGDGMTNWEENMSGTDPRDPESYLKIAGIHRGIGLEIVFEAQSNRTYSVEYREQVEPALWRRLAEVSASPTNRMMRISDVSGSPGRYYRLGTPRFE